MEQSALIKNESIRRLEEGLGRIHKCVGMLSDSQVWHRPNSNVVSVGNLILHLTGNVGQWIISTLGDRPDERDRDREFSESGPMDRAELLERLDRTMQRQRSPLKTCHLNT